MWILQVIMLTNFDLEKLCHEYKVPIHAVVMKNELPPKVKDGNYIVNLQSSTQGDGTHWTGLIVEKKNALFFDPFGAEPSQEIVDFIKKRKDCTLGYTSRDIQDLTSHNCGYFCLAFLLHLKDCTDLFDAANEFVNTFDNISKNNDIRLGDVFRAKGGKISPLIRRLWK